MGCFSIQRERPRAKYKLSSAFAQPSMEALEELKMGDFSSRFSNNCDNGGRQVAVTHHRSVSHGLTGPYTRARTAFRSASAKLVRQHSKALSLPRVNKIRSFHREPERAGGSAGYGLRGQEVYISRSAPLASGRGEGTALQLFPLPLPPSDMCATSNSESSPMQSMSSSSSASSSLSCSSAPFSGSSGSSVSPIHKAAERSTLSSIARPLPLPPASEMGASPQEYSYEELAGACLNFTQEFFVRDGGAGPVFRALVRDNPDEESSAEIAVTRLSTGHLHSPKKWRAEVGILGRLSHSHICQVLGFSREDPSGSVNEQRERLLVYEHTSNGNLESLLYGRKGRTPPLDWDTRIKIALGAARGLAFLHERTPRQIVYKIFKTLNIQVDHDFNVKLSDYGFTRTPKELPFEVPAPLLPSECAYAAPETRSYDEVTPKSNVWSYGIVLLELLTGRQNMDDFFTVEERNLLQWCRPYLLDPKRLYLVMDPELKGRYATRKAKMVADLALRCLLDDPAARPSMLDVVALLTPRVGSWPLPADTMPRRALLSDDFCSNDNFCIRNGGVLGVKSNYSKSNSLASVLASPARCFAGNMHARELHCSPARESKVRFREFLSGEILKESSHPLGGWRGEHPFIPQSLYLRGEVLACADESWLNKLVF